MLAFVILMLIIGVIGLLLIDMLVRVTMLHVVGCMHKLRVVNFLIVVRHVRLIEVVMLFSCF